MEPNAQQHPVNMIYRRVRHHARASGYARISEFIDAHIIEPPRHRSLLQRAVVRAFHFLVDRADSRWYHRDSLYNEMQAARLWLGRTGQIFHYIYGENHFRYLGRLKRLRRGNVIVCTYHTPPAKFRELIGEFSHLADIDAVIIVSNVQREFFAQLVGPERVFFVPLGIDTDHYRPEPERARTGPPFSGLFVGSHMRDLATLANAARLLAAEAVPLTLSVVTPEQFHPQFAGLPNVRLLSNISDAELLNLYQQSDIYLFPLLDCTANNGLLEAMACGLPIVSTDLEGVRDYVNDECSLLTPLGDAQALAQAVRGLCEDGERRLRMAQASRARALEFRWDRIAEQIHAVYERAAAMAAKGRAA